MKARKIYFEQESKNKMLLEGLSYSNNPDYKTLKCGNIDFTKDIWELTDFTPRELSLKYCDIDFRKIQNKTFKNTVKQYAWYLIGNTTSKNKFQSIPNKISMLIYNLIPFMKKHKIGSLKRFKKKHFEEYLIYLEKNKKDNLRKRPYSPKTLCRKAILLQDIAEIAIKYDWDDAPDELLLYSQNMYDYWDIKKAIRKTKDINKAIPKEVLEQIKIALTKETKYILSEHGIMKNMKYSIENTLSWTLHNWVRLVNPRWRVKSKDLLELNIYKYITAITMSTGLRISEVLNLESDCAWHEDSYFGKTYYLNRLSSKTEPEPKKRRILINKETYELIQEVLNVFKEIRGRGRILFARKNRNHSAIYSDYPSKVSESEYRYELKKFIKKHNISHISENGKKELYPLHPHQFRHTFAQQLIDDGVPIRVIKKHYAHVSIDMTVHYAKVKEETLEKDYIKTYIDADSIYTNGNLGNDFKEMIDNVRTVKDMDEVIDTLSKRFGINPLPMGMCLKDFKKGHCDNTGSEGCYYIGCTDFVTNDSFLTNFKRQKELIDNEIERTKDNKFAKMNFHVNQRKRDKLKQIINRLETDKIYKEVNNNGK